jgi:integrase/recombinase XerD
VNAASTLARALHGFFLDYLPKQRALSPHTHQSYRDGIKLLLKFLAGKSDDTSHLDVEQISVERIRAFLDHLETTRHNGVGTRNVRRAAVLSFFRYLGAQYPEHMDQVQRILGIPSKRAIQREIQHLEFDEIQALLNGIDRSHANYRRDLALLTFLFNTGARVSEAVGLQACDLRLTLPAHVLLRGKGRKERTCPIWADTARLLRELLAEQSIGYHDPSPVFHNHRGHPLTRFGIRLILKKHLLNTAKRVQSLRGKRLHPHSLRHSTALHLLASGVDLSTIAHWLGHASVNTTNKYLSLNLEAKREALSKARPLIRHQAKVETWRTNSDLIHWLERL